MENYNTQRNKKWCSMGEHQKISRKIVDPYAKKVHGGWVVVAPIKVRTFNPCILEDRMSAVKKFNTEKQCLKYISDNYTTR